MDRKDVVEHLRTLQKKPAEVGALLQEAGVLYEVLYLQVQRGWMYVPEVGGCILYAPDADVYLVGVSDRIEAMKALRAVFGYSLATAQGVLGNMPCVLAEGLPLGAAEEMRERLERVGCTLKVEKNSYD